MASSPDGTNVRTGEPGIAPIRTSVEMAKAAASYVHPKLAAIEIAGTLSDKPPSQMTDEELTAVIREGQAQRAAMCTYIVNEQQAPVSTRARSDLELV